MAAYFDRISAHRGPTTTTTTTKSRASIALAYAISGPMNIAPPD